MKVNVEPANSSYSITTEVSEGDDMYMYLEYSKLILPLMEEGIKKHPDRYTIEDLRKLNDQKVMKELLKITRYNSEEVMDKFSIIIAS